MTRKRIITAAGIALVVAIVAGAAFFAYDKYFGPKEITAYFSTATAVYPGDEVRVSGVRVGTIESIEPQGIQTRMTLRVDRSLSIPADAKAVIVAQNLIAARYVQLAPAYRSSGPTMADGAVIPLDRTAVPVEWDEVKTQLMRLATDLGPTGTVSTTSVGRFIDSAANALDGNGEKLRETLTQLAGVGRVLAGGGGDLVDIVKNLQIFVSALKDSGAQIVSFQNRLASVSSVLDGSKTDLDAALTNLSEAVGEVQRFIAGTRNQTAEQLQRLSNVTQILVDQRLSLENILHAAPTQFANAYNIYNPDTGSALGGFVLNNFSNPVQFLCTSLGAIENTTAPETAKLCADYLGPALRLFSLNYLPIPVNPYLMKSASPENILYSEARLSPGGEGPKPATVPDVPPAVSAYTGLLDQPFPAPAAVPPPYPPLPTAQLPAFPSPAQYPRSRTIGDMLLPPESLGVPALPNPPPNSSPVVPLPDVAATPPLPAEAPLTTAPGTGERTPGS